MDKPSKIINLLLGVGHTDQGCMCVISANVNSHCKLLRKTSKIYAVATFVSYSLQEKYVHVINISVPTATCKVTWRHYLEDHQQRCCQVFSQFFMWDYRVSGQYSKSPSISIVFSWVRSRW
jgi:hypothetical protein